MSSETPDTPNPPSGPGRLAGSPLGVYAILGLGVVTLLVLLGIIYFSSDDRDRPERPICTNITAAEAEQAIYNDEVERLTVNYDETGDPKSGDRYGPVVASLSYRNGQCANLPQGVQGVDAVYQVLGVIAFYNDTTENAQVEVVKEHNDALAESLYWTPTPLPTETPEVTETPAVTETPPVLPPDAETPTPTEESSASPAASPQASPAAP